jgi:hypothetical protein
MIKYSVAVFFFILVIGCASSSKVKSGDEKADKNVSEKYDESFDPTTLNDDDIEIGRENNNNTVTEPVEQHPVKPENKSNDKVVMHEIEGYRVQILATSSIEAATLQQQKAIDKFADHEYKIYLIYEAPLYRLRMGDATNRREAEVIRDLAKERGYDEAFIVRSKVVVPE